jgi:hypothetical protein
MVFFLEVREGIFPTVLYQARDSNSDRQAHCVETLAVASLEGKIPSSLITNNNQVLEQEFFNNQVLGQEFDHE